MNQIFINNFVSSPTDYTNNLEDCLKVINNIDQLETFLELICTKYKTDKYGTTTWCNDHVIVRSGYFKQFSIPLSVTIKDNQYKCTKSQIECWTGFRKVCEMVRSREYL